MTDYNQTKANRILGQSSLWLHSVLSLTLHLSWFLRLHHLSRPSHVKSLLPCIDYRELNDITVKNRYSLPPISTAFELLDGAKIFTKLDLHNHAYQLVHIKEGDEWKIAFNTPTGYYEYLVMPLGLTNAPAVFYNLVNGILQDMLNIFVLVYLDNILIFSPDEDTHKGYVRKVLQRLLNNQLHVKVEKCEFHKRSVSFLGFVLAEGEIRVDHAKFSIVAERAY